MPTNCWGRYNRIAVMEVIKGTIPKSISKRAKGVVQIPFTWEKCHVGKTEKSCFARSLAEANEICAKLNQTKTAKKKVSEHD